MNNVIRSIPHNSQEYNSAVALRYDILRKPLGLFYTPEQLEAEKDEYHFAAFEGDMLIASITMVPVNKDIIKMRQFAVKQELQKKGIGTELVSYCEEWAKMNGYKEIVLHARLTAVPFYRRLNYTTIGDEFTEVGLPHYKMTKKL